MNNTQFIALACFGFFAIGVLNWRIVLRGAVEWIGWILEKGKGS